MALIEEANVPAPKEGLLTEITIDEGDLVQTGGPMAQIDIREATVKLRAAKHELSAAEEEAKSDVRVRASQAAAQVAEAELAQARRHRARATNSVSETEVRRLELSAERYRLETEVAQKDLTIAGITQEAKAVLVEQAQLELTKLKINSPLDGVVVQVYKNLGEWVTPGDPVARVVAWTACGSKAT